MTVVLKTIDRDARKPDAAVPVTNGFYEESEVNQHL